MNTKQIKEKLLELGNDIDHALGLASEANGDLDDIQRELQDLFDEEMTEKQQDGELGDLISNTIDNIDETRSELDNAYDREIINTDKLNGIK
jgi:hypothetical protein